MNKGRTDEFEQVHCIWGLENGERCRSFKRAGTEFCYWHDPATEEERATGFKRRDGKPSTPVLCEAPPLETTADVEALLKQVTLYMATNPQPDPRRATAINALAAGLLRAINLRALEEELAAARQSLADLREDGDRQHAERQRLRAWGEEWRADSVHHRKRADSLKKQLEEAGIQPLPPPEN